ncbi:hypothetical protein D3C74_421780 [compost metagenome]
MDEIFKGNQLCAAHNALSGVCCTEQANRCTAARGTAGGISYVSVEDPDQAGQGGSHRVRIRCERRLPAEAQAGRDFFSGHHSCH